MRAIEKLGIVINAGLAVTEVCLLDSIYTSCWTMIYTHQVGVVLNRHTFQIEYVSLTIKLIVFILWPPNCM